MLVKSRNRATLRKTLATMPETLDQTYNRILYAISGEDCAYAIRILQQLTFSARPLCVEEIAQVVAIDVSRDPPFNHEEVLEDPLKALNIYSSLVTISINEAKGRSNPPQQIIALAHYSVQEYLVSDKIKQGPAKQYSMHKAKCHSIITTACLKYLIQLQQPLTKDFIQTSALARYTAEFQANYLVKKREKVEGLIQTAMVFMSIENPTYLTQIQLYNPDRPWMRPDLRKGLESVAAPLYYTAILGLSEITKLLLNQGAKVNTKGGRYNNALHAASLKGHKQVA